MPIHMYVCYVHINIIYLCIYGRDLDIHIGVYWMSLAALYCLSIVLSTFHFVPILYIIFSVALCRCGSCCFVFVSTVIVYWQLSSLSPLTTNNFRFLPFYLPSANINSGRILQLQFNVLILLLLLAWSFALKPHLGGYLAESSRKSPWRSFAKRRR